jgi:hypothetical protein
MKTPFYNAEEYVKRQIDKAISEFFILGDGYEK